MMNMRTDSIERHSVTATCTSVENLIDVDSQMFSACLACNTVGFGKRRPFSESTRSSADADNALDAKEAVPNK